MARAHGRKGRLYMALASGGSAAPVAFINSFSIDLSTQQVDVTAFEDNNMVYVSGLPDAKGSYAGFFDDATKQMITASLDGVSRKFYWYPDKSVNTIYFFGTGNFSTSQNWSTTTAGTISGNWTAASECQWVGLP